MNITPINGNIIVKIIEEQKKKGLVLIASDNLKITHKVVVKLPNVFKNTYEFAVGDKVITEKYKGQSFMDNDVEYMLVKYEDIIAYEKST